MTDAYIASYDAQLDSHEPEETLDEGTNPIDGIEDWAYACDLIGQDEANRYGANDTMRICQELVMKELESRKARLPSQHNALVIHRLRMVNAMLFAMRAQVGMLDSGGDEDHLTACIDVWVYG